ncbi:hypothetical protein IAU60_003903 [Kwoniella sp. DSM 27419]
MNSASPTPTRPVRSLLPSSPIQQGLERNRMKRTSSTDGIGIKGLSNWRRLPKTTGSSQGTHAGKSGSTERSGSDTKKGSQSTGSRARTRSVISGRKTSGPGMGMRGTPAKKVRRSSKASIGTESTPAGLRRPLGVSALEDTLPDSPASSIPLSSADDITSPSISGPEYDSIRPTRKSSSDDWTEPYQRADSRNDLANDQTPSPLVRDLLLPLIDFCLVFWIAVAYTEQSF